MVNTDASLAEELNTIYNSFEGAAHSVNGVSRANNAVSSIHSQSAGENTRENKFTIPERDVRKAFRKVSTRKAAGPDSIMGQVLRACTDQLAAVFTEIFNLSL